MRNVGQKLRAAILEKDWVKIKTLLKNGADPNAIIPDEDFAAIHLGAGTTKSITRLLLKHGANPNLQTSEGSTPLHIATSCGKSDILKVLLKYGADVSIRDNENLAPIEVAQHYQYWDCLDILQTQCKKRIGNQRETEKKKRGLSQSIDSPAQVQVDVHRQHIDVFTGSFNKKSGGRNINDSGWHSRTRSRPLMSATFSLPEQKGSFYDKESDSVTSRESSNESIRRKRFLIAGSNEHDCGNPDSDDYVSADPSLDTDSDGESIQAEAEEAEEIKISSTKINHQNGFHIGNKSENQRNRKHSLTKNRTFSDRNHQNKEVDNFKDCISSDSSSSLEKGEHSNRTRHLEYLIRPESACKYIVKNDSTESDGSTVNFDTVSTIISTMPNDVHSQCGSKTKLATDNLEYHKHGLCIPETTPPKEFLHYEELRDQIKRGRQPSIENVRATKKSDFYNEKKTESKSQESLGEHCSCNKHLQIKIDLRFGQLKSEAQKLGNSSTKGSTSARSHHSIVCNDVSLRCLDKTTGNKPRVANIKSAVQPNNIYDETIHNEIYKFASNVMNDPVIKVRAKSYHDVHCTVKNGTKQNGNGKNVKEAFVSERHQKRRANVSGAFTKKDSREGYPPRQVEEGSKTQRKLLKDKLLKDLKNHLQIS